MSLKLRGYVEYLKNRLSSSRKHKRKRVSLPQSSIQFIGAGQAFVKLTRELTKQLTIEEMQGPIEETQGRE